MAVERDHYCVVSQKSQTKTPCRRPPTLGSVQFARVGYNRIMGATSEKYSHHFSTVKEEDYKEFNPYWWQECLPIVDGKVQWGPNRTERDYNGKGIEEWTWPRDGYLIRDVRQFRIGCSYPTLLADGRRMKGPYQDAERVMDRAKSFCDLISLWENECEEFNRTFEDGTV